MNKLTTVIASAVCGLTISAPALAYDDDDAAWDYAQVVRSEPIYRDVRVSEPREVCRDEPVTERMVYNRGPDPGAVLFGAIIGGVIGHQIGGGHGRDVATAAGAMIGANHAANATYRDGHVVERTTYETTCRDVGHTRYVSEIEGYDVTYRWHGHLYHTRKAYDPGKRIRVRVDVQPYDDED